MRAALTLLLGLLAAPAALATPQIAIRSVSRCDTCHVQPTGWHDPADVFERKCTLNCNSCHVSPTGGAMRNEAGRFYALHSLPMFMARQADAAYQTVELGGEVPASQALVPASQPAPGSQPAGSQPAGSQPAGSQPAGSQPIAAGSQPAGPTSRPATRYAPELRVPAPGTAARYAGIEPHPTFQVGTDLRMALYSELGDEGDTSFFPMQTDLMLAWRPYNPQTLNEGRVTVLINGGAQGSRGEEFDGFADRAFVREWYAMYHDLPANAYVRAGRFLPAHGWRTDDHTHFTRQRQQLFGQNWDFERQVTGVEVGANPNYPYAHVSVFNPADQWDKPIDADAGIGTALTGGWRDLAWQAGGSLAYGHKQGDQVAASGELGLNLEVLTGLPLLYLGQYMVNHQAPEDGRSFTGLAAFHEVDWWIMQGLNLRLRYDWSDPDVELKFDSAHQLTASLDVYPTPYVELITQYRHGWTNDENRFEIEGDALLFMLHAFY
ncbi:MAG: hypothetical protein R3F60_17135 [bacterium]